MNTWIGKKDAPETRIKKLEEEVHSLKIRLEEVSLWARQAKAENKEIRTIIDKLHPQEDQ